MSDEYTDGKHYVEVPDPWQPLEYLCSPRNGSKAYKHPNGANVHIINMYDTGNYIAQIEHEDGEFQERRFIPWGEAVKVAEDWMKNQVVDTDTKHS